MSGSTSSSAEQGKRVGKKKYRTYGHAWHSSINGHAHHAASTSSSSSSSSQTASAEVPEIIARIFPNSMRDFDFVERSYRHLEKLGFDKTNAIPCVSLCRDELTGDLLDLIDKQWKSSFSSTGPGPEGEAGAGGEEEDDEDTDAFVMSSLAGFLLLGDTGISAALHHSPVDPAGRERFVFYVFPHIGINDAGELGKVHRPGIGTDSTACGALIAFRNQLLQACDGDTGGSTNHNNNSGDGDRSRRQQRFRQYVDRFAAESEPLDPNDIEQSIIKRKICRKLKNDHSEAISSCPDLLTITRICQSIILEDLKSLIHRNIDNGYIKHCDFAVFSGIQIHGPHFHGYVFPGECYAVVGDGDNRKKFELSF